MVIPDIAVPEVSRHVPETVHAVIAGILFTHPDFSVYDTKPTNSKGGINTGLNKF